MVGYQSYPNQNGLLALNVTQIWAYLGKKASELQIGRGKSNGVCEWRKKYIRAKGEHSSAYTNWHLRKASLEQMAIAFLNDELGQTMFPEAKDDVVRPRLIHGLASLFFKQNLLYIKNLEVLNSRRTPRLNSSYSSDSPSDMGDDEVYVPTSRAPWSEGSLLSRSTDSIEPHSITSSDTFAQQGTAFSSFGSSARQRSFTEFSSDSPREDEQFSNTFQSDFRTMPLTGASESSKRFKGLEPQINGNDSNSEPRRVLKLKLKPKETTNSSPALLQNPEPITTVDTSTTSNASLSRSRQSSSDFSDHGDSDGEENLSAAETHSANPIASSESGGTNTQAQTNSVKEVQVAPVAPPMSSETGPAPRQISQKANSVNVQPATESSIPMPSRVPLHAAFQSNPAPSPSSCPPSDVRSPPSVRSHQDSAVVSSQGPPPSTLGNTCSHFPPELRSDPEVQRSLAKIIAAARFPAQSAPTQTGYQAHAISIVVQSRPNPQSLQSSPKERQARVLVTNLGTEPARQLLGEISPLPSQTPRPILAMENTNLSQIDSGLAAQTESAASATESAGELTVRPLAKGVNLPPVVRPVSPKGLSQDKPKGPNLVFYLEKLDHADHRSIMEWNISNISQMSTSDLNKEVTAIHGPGYESQMELSITSAKLYIEKKFNAADKESYAEALRFVGRHLTTAWFKTNKGNEVYEITLKIKYLTKLDDLSEEVLF